MTRSFQESWSGSIKDGLARMPRCSPGVVVLDAQLGWEHARGRLRLEGVQALRVAAGSDDRSRSHEAGHRVVQAWNGGCGACSSMRIESYNAAVHATEHTAQRTSHAQAKGCQCLRWSQSGSAVKVPWLITAVTLPGLGRVL